MICQGSAAALASLAAPSLSSHRIPVRKTKGSGVTSAHGLQTEDGLLPERPLLSSERHGSEAGAEPAPRLRRNLRERARGGAVPLRRLEEQALLRRDAQRDRLQGHEDRRPCKGQAPGLQGQADRKSVV